MSGTEQARGEKLSGQTPKSTEKMKIVVDSLRANPNVVVVGGFEENHLQSGRWPRPAGFWSRTLDIYTHPTKPMYDAYQLNEFMFSLVPELEPTCSDKFWGGNRLIDRELQLGKLYFDEEIGRATLKATVSLDEGLSVVTTGVLEQTWDAEEDLRLEQRTWVRVFPDREHLLDAAQGVNEYRIPTSDLGRRHADAGHTVAALLQTPMLGAVIDAPAIGV